MNIKYAYEKLNDAVLVLATNGQPLRKRLERAFQYSLLHIQKNNLPKALAIRLENLYKEFDIQETYVNEGTIISALRYMSPKKMTYLAAEIVYLYGAIAIELGTYKNNNN